MIFASPVASPDSTNNAGSGVGGLFGIGPFTLDGVNIAVNSKLPGPPAPAPSPPPAP